MTSLMNACMNANYLNHTILSTFDQDYTMNDIVREKDRIIALLGETVDLSGQRVALLLPDTFQYIAVLFAVNQLGGTVVPISLQYRSGDIAALLDAAKPHLIFAADEHNGVMYSEIFRQWQSNSHHRYTLYEWRTHSQEWSRHEFAGEPAPKDDLYQAFIFFTSGSTGVPKGMVFEQDNLLPYLEVYPRLFHLKETDCYLNIPPLTLLAGFVSLLSALHVGCRLCIPDQFDFHLIARQMKRTGCNKMTTTPSILKALYSLTRHVEPKVFENLQDCYLVGEMITEGLVDDFDALRHTNFRGVFGISEAGGVMSRDLRKSAEWELDPAIQFRLEETDGVSELTLKAPTLFKCYYQQPEANRDAMTDDGYFKTGDIVQLTANNKIIVMGRKKDLIKKGGVQVVPGEVEKTLLSHPQVLQAAVIGAPHEVFGEQVVAFVIPRGAVAASELYEHCAARIARYKVPDRIEFVDSFPLTSGKTDKVALRQMLNKR